MQGPATRRLRARFPNSYNALMSAFRTCDLRSIPAPVKIVRDSSCVSTRTQLITYSVA